jgi:hypothetical protein
MSLTSLVAQPPIAQVIDAGVIPRLLELATHPNEDVLVRQFEMGLQLIYALL